MAHLRDQLRDQLKRVRDHLNRALVRCNQLRDSHPREVKAAIRVTAAVAILCVVAAGWFLLSLTRSLPDQGIADRDGRNGPGHRGVRRQRCPGVHDLQRTAYRRAARLDGAAPGQGARRDRGSPLLRSSRLRRHPHRVGGVEERPTPARGPGRQHDHAAARAHEFPDTGQDLQPQAAGSHPGRADRTDVLEGPDPRAVSQQGVLRRRPVRRRSGVAGLFREARRPTSRWRRRRRLPG